MSPKRLCLVFLCLASSMAAPDGDPIVAVTGGRIRGRLTPDGGAAFKGIPFARPPLGDLRWRDPRPAEPWDGIRDAGRFSPACTQLSEGWNRRFVAASAEDCLYLNVAPPKWPPREKYPVMVWIHGGSNTAGDGDDAGFDARTLVRRGLVLVTINYRLGALGFLAHPELAAESPHHTSGNYGLLDQIAALEWVQGNVARFGGDPGNVTVIGESAGAFDIGLLMTSPRARGLFHRAIAESGAVAGFHGPRTKARAEEIARKLAARLQAPPEEAIRYLRSVPAVKILRETQIASDGDRWGLETSLDGWVLPESPAAVFARGGSMDVPLLIGSNGQEIAGVSGPARVRAAISKAYGALAPRALALYGLAGEGSGAVDPVYGGPGIQWATDTGFRCPATEQALGHTAAGRAAYQYEFDRPQPGKQFTVHASELNFLFGTWAKDVKLTPVDRKISSQMQAYWANFARTGDPNGEGLPRWPAFTADERSYMAFTSEGAVAKSGLRRAYCDLWREAR
jgi:para-nitrobenzyl esterase